MPDSAEGLTLQPLSLPEELILMLLNEETGYFHQVDGWELNCAVVGAALAELSLRSRIDTDMEALLLVDRRQTGDPALDPILEEIADEPVQRNARYWIERLAVQAETIVDLTLDRLVDLKILNHPRRRVLDPGAVQPVCRRLRQRPGRHSRPVHQDAHQRVYFHRHDPRSERHHRRLPRQYLRCVSLHIRTRRRSGKADRPGLQDGSDRPFHSRRGRTHHRQPVAPAFGAEQANPPGFAAPIALQSSCAPRQHSRRFCRPHKRIRPGVRDPLSVRQTDDFSRRARRQTAGCIGTGGCI